jgi:lipopolysaccharide biosynthesis glycosyltransferase
MPNLINKSSTNYLHIALGFDENYIVPIYALLTSIFYNNRDSAIIFHVIATGLNEIEKDDIKEYVRKNNAEIFYYSVNEEEVRKSVYIPANTHFTIATYYRLFFPSLMTGNVQKLLYIDSDTIVTGNLKELYNIDIGNAPIGAATDSGPHPGEALGIKGKENYFNAGVLLINIKNWREQMVTENALKFLAQYPEKIKYVDQDALNATLIDRWFRIDNKYNVTWFDVSLQVPKKELIKDTIIIHYTTPNKPWHCLARNKLRTLYHHYLKLSPKRGERRYTDFEFKNIYVFLRIRIKEFYFDHQINRIIPIKKWMEPSEVY